MTKRPRLKLTETESESLRALVVRAANERRITPQQSVDIRKNPAVGRMVVAGEKTPEQAASITDALKNEAARRDAETGESAYRKMMRLLAAIESVSQEEWEAVEGSLYNVMNTPVFGRSFGAHWVEAVERALRLAQHSSTARTIDARPRSE